MEFIRIIRNVVILTCMGLGALLAALYLCGALFVYLVWGMQYVHIDLSMITALFKYGWWMLVNIKHLTWEYQRYMPAKLAGSCVGVFGVLGIMFYKFRAPIKDFRPYEKKESIHGDAAWATEEDVKRAGLRSKDGLMLGRDSGGYFISAGFQHALLFAPTGSGKGVGFVIPNLLFWSDSCIVHDIKLENHELTSGWRHKMGQRVYVWSPAEPDGFTHCYNPIDWVSSKPGQMVDDVQKIANLIMPEKEFWNNEARSLFVGVVLYLLAVPEKAKSFGEVVRTMRSEDVVYNLAVVLDTIGKHIHPVSYMNLAAFLQKADKERSGVISTMNSSLELWANPLIDTATASSDFNIQTFKRERTTVYVGLTPDNIQRLEPLMKVFYQQATEFLSRRIPKKEEEPYGVLFLMDEFPTLGKMEQFKTGIAYFRGYNVRLFLIIQDTEQLKGTYEEAGMNSFLSNSTYRITFAANNMETANLISQLCGNKTVQQESLNKPKFLDFNPASRSVHVSEAQRALLLPQEVILLPKDEQIVLIESFPPIRSKKIRYFEDRFFTKRLLPAMPVPQQEPYDPAKFVPKKSQTEEAPVEDPANTMPTLAATDAMDEDSSVSSNTTDETGSHEAYPSWDDEDDVHHEDPHGDLDEEDHHDDTEMHEPLDHDAYEEEHEQEHDHEADGLHEALPEDGTEDDVKE